MDRRLRLFIVGIAWVGVAGRLPAQGTTEPWRPSLTSHRTLRGIADPSKVDFEKTLEDRLGLYGEKGEIQDGLQAILRDPEKARKLAGGKLSEAQLKFLHDNRNQILELWKNPQFRRLVEQAAAKPKSDGELPLQQIDTLKMLAENKLDPDALTKAQSAGKSAQGEADPATAGNAAKGFRRGPVVQEPSQPLAPQEQEQSLYDKFYERIAESIVQRLNDPANAGMLESAVRSLGGIQPGADGSERFDLAALWRGAADNVTSWLPQGWRMPQRLPDGVGSFVNDVRSAASEVGNPAGDALSRLPVGGPSSGTEVGGQVIAWVVAGVAFAIIGWTLLGKQGAGGPAGESAAALGPWPVEPEAVANREDVVRAFEYLAVLRLGPAGRMCNHLDVAARLAGGVDDPRRNAAGELARLYERSRYAPDAAPLGESDLAAARRDLTLLAGAAAA